jgi:tetratricopeptide (TPR) repeat protein
MVSVRGAALAGLVVVAAGWATPVEAAPAKGGREAEARTHFARGRELYGKGDLPGAIVEMQRAYDLAPSPVLLFNMGKVHEQLGNPEEAAAFYERYVKESPDASDREVVEAKVRRLRDLAAERAAKGNPQDRAAEHFKRGRELYRDGDYQAALAELTQAFSLVPSSTLLYNMAKTREKLGDHAGAIRDFQGYLEREPQAPDRLDVEATVRSLQDRIKVEVSDFTLESVPAGADVFLDGADKLAGQTPLTFRLAPGPHGVRVAKAGFLDQTREFVMPADRPLTLAFELKPKQEHGWLSVECRQDGAHVFVDGTILALTPLQGRRAVPPGRRQVVIEKDGHGRFNRVVDVVIGRETRVKVDLDGASGRAKWPLFLAPLLGMPLGLAGWVGAAVSTGFAVRSAQSIAGTSWWRLGLAVALAGGGLAGVLLAAGLGVVAAVVAAWVVLGLVPRAPDEVAVLPPEAAPASLVPTTPTGPAMPGTAPSAAVGGAP